MFTPKNQQTNVCFENLPSAPLNPSPGQAYYDTTLKKFAVYQDNAWAYLEINSGGLSEEEVQDLAAAAALSAFFDSENGRKVFLKTYIEQKLGAASGFTQLNFVGINWSAGVDLSIGRVGSFVGNYFGNNDWNGAILDGQIFEHNEAETIMDMSDSDFSGCSLVGTSFLYVDLTGATFSIDLATFKTTCTYNAQTLWTDGLAVDAVRV